ncbi:MAG: hypothetical protein HZB19_15095 [Chloroflexi bacterium]|nr:hypothetical protein [Chloroflexota bacterium]
MLENIMVIYHQIREAWTGGSLRDIFRPRVFRQRVATPVEMDLSGTIPHPADFLQGSDYRFVELKMDELRAGKWSFAVSSRRFKVHRNLKKGLRNFALVKDSTVVGDVWCASPHKDGNPVTHPDLKMLGISCGEKEVYAFDMLIDPIYRGKNFAVLLQRFLHFTLKMEGFRKVYGFYWDDNLPALWMHRMLKYKELPKRRVSRFFFLKSMENAIKPDSSIKVFDS